VDDDTSEDRDGFLAWVRGPLHEAEMALHNGDAGPRRALWSRDMAYTVGLEHTAASVDGEPRAYTLRATQIYRWEDGGWKVAHRHGDEITGPPADPG
jgi:ketosteroid isomerase-like protein